MFKFSPRRTGRYRGLKVKHALQIGLLVGICVWLLYQVQHLHNKKVVFEESAKAQEKVRNGNGIISLGRKFSPQLEQMSIQDERQKVEEEADNQLYGEESKNEEGQSKGEGNERGNDEMHKYDQASQDGGHRVDFVDGEKDTEESRENVIIDKGEEDIEKESKEKAVEEKKSEIKENEQGKEKGSVEKENEEREIQKGKGENKEKESEENTEKESVQEKDDREMKRGERDREGTLAKDINGNEGYDDRERKSKKTEKEENKVKTEDVITSQDQVSDEYDRKNDEAGEENQKRDDSSFTNAVLDSHNMTEYEKVTENSSGEQQIKNEEFNKLEGDNTNNTEIVDANHGTDSSEKGSEAVENSNYSNVMTGEQRSNETNLPEIESHSNSNIGETKESKKQQQVGMNTTATGEETHSSSLENGEDAADSTQGQNRTVDEPVSKRDDIVSNLMEQTEKLDTIGSSRKSDLESSLSTTTWNTETGEFTDSSNKIESVVLGGKNIYFDGTSGAGNSPETSIAYKIGDSLQNDKSSPSSGAGAEEKVTTQNENENLDAGQNVSESFSDSSVFQDEKKTPPNTDNSTYVTQHDAVDSSNSSILQEDKDARMDLETLPDTSIKGNNNEDAVAK